MAVFIDYTDRAKANIRDITAYFLDFMDEATAISKVDAILEEIVKVSNSPLLSGTKIEGRKNDFRKVFNRYAGKIIKTQTEKSIFEPLDCFRGYLFHGGGSVR